MFYAEAPAERVQKCPLVLQFTGVAHRKRLRFTERKQTQICRRDGAVRHARRDAIDAGRGAALFPAFVTAMFRLAPLMAQIFRALPPR